MTIFITGDIHGTHDILKLSEFSEGRGAELTKADYLIIAGDFGLLWYPEGSEDDKEDAKWRKWLNDQPWTTLFIDGNHECINSKSDVLTENGWMNIVDAYKSNIKIANVNMDNHRIYFDYPLNRIKKHSDTIIDICGVNYKQSVTLNHDVIVNGEKVKAQSLIGKNLFEEELRYYIDSSDNKINMSNTMIEILTAVVMDATIVDYSKYNKNSHKIRIQFHLKKQRKIDYIQNILNKENIPYTVRNGVNNDTYICIYGYDGRKIYNLLNNKKELPRYFVDMSEEQFRHLLNALSNTDGTSVNNNVIWRTTSLNDVDIVQELCVKHNYDIRVKKQDNMSGYNKENCKTQYICSLGFNKNLHRKISITQHEYNDYVYCFTMPHGTLITRYDSCVCVTGNCFERLNNYPVNEWHGGKIHMVEDSVYHLMRGQVFDINGKKFFTLGGAYSHDKQWRTEGLSWWAEEVPSQEERNEALVNLDTNDWKVDYVVTHDAPVSIAKRLIEHKWDRDTDEYEEWLQNEIADKLDFKHWYFGHHHTDCGIGNNGKYQALYYDIVKIY